MKSSIMTVIAILITANAFADTQSSGFSKQSHQLKSLGSAFKSQPTVAPKIDPSDITMGYAGQDISSKPILA
jgi:hypothetical protein